MNALFIQNINLDYIKKLYKQRNISNIEKT